MFYNNFCQVCRKKLKPPWTSYGLKGEFSARPPPHLADSYNASAVEKGPQSYAYMKIPFSRCMSSVNVATHGVVSWLSWPHYTLLCILVCSLHFYGYFIAAFLCNKTCLTCFLSCQLYVNEKEINKA